MTKVTWDLEKNGVSEKDVCKANKNYWWLCEKGHSWQAKYKNVRVNKHGCPYCSNQKVLIGYNDLQTTEPEIASGILGTVPIHNKGFLVLRYTFQKPGACASGSFYT